MVKLVDRNLMKFCKILQSRYGVIWFTLLFDCFIFRYLERRNKNKVAVGKVGKVSKIVQCRNDVVRFTLLFNCFIFR